MSDDDDFNRLMDATQTLIQLKPGDILTEDMIADLHLVDADHRESFERATDAFHRGYQDGLERGGGADTAKLIEERDSARTRAQVANAISSAAERWGFIKGAQACREMMARFVEQGGTTLSGGAVNDYASTCRQLVGIPTEPECGQALRQDQAAIPAIWAMVQGRWVGPALRRSRSPRYGSLNAPQQLPVSRARMGLYRVGRRAGQS